MTHPTDEALEAMAAKLEGSACLKQIFDAAAMLRAMKGRVRVKPLEWEQARDGAGWHPQLTIAYCPVFDKRFYAEHPEKQARIDAAREARILTALEPAPGYLEGWNDAREADGRPCSTDRFLAALFDETDDHFDRAEAIKHWLEGGWNDAMEGFSETAIRALTPPERIKA